MCERFCYGVEKRALFWWVTVTCRARWAVSGIISMSGWLWLQQFLNTARCVSFSPYSISYATYFLHYYSQDTGRNCSSEEMFLRGMFFRGIAICFFMGDVFPCAGTISYGIGGGLKSHAVLPSSSLASLVLLPTSIDAAALLAFFICAFGLVSTWSVCSVGNLKPEKRGREQGVPFSGKPPDVTWRMCRVSPLRGCHRYPTAARQVLTADVLEIFLLSTRRLE